MAVQLNHTDKKSFYFDFGLMLETYIYFIMVFISSLNLVFFKIFVSLLFIYCLIKIISKFCQFDFDAVKYSEKPKIIALIGLLVLFLLLTPIFVSYYWIFIKNHFIFREEYAKIGYFRFQTYNESLSTILELQNISLKYLNNLEVVNKYESFLYVLEFLNVLLPFVLFLKCLFKIKKEVETLINGQEDNKPCNSVLHGKADDSEKQFALETLKDDDKTCSKGDNPTIRDSRENQEKLQYETKETRFNEE